MENEYSANKAQALTKRNAPKNTRIHIRAEIVRANAMRRVPTVPLILPDDDHHDDANDGDNALDFVMAQ